MLRLRSKRLLRSFRISCTPHTTIDCLQLSSLHSVNAAPHRPVYSCHPLRAFRTEGDFSPQAQVQTRPSLGSKAFCALGSHPLLTPPPSSGLYGAQICQCISVRWNDSNGASIWHTYPRAEHKWRGLSLRNCKVADHGLLPAHTVLEPSFPVSMRTEEY